LAQLEAEIVRMQNETERYKARTAEQLQRKQRMSREIQAIRERIGELKASASQVAESKKKELRRQIEVLGRKLVLHLSPE
jgi:NOL1/NOP2/fmu family ribosome biogenesis protein